MRRDLVQRAMAHDQEAFTELALLAIDKLYAIARLDPPLAGAGGGRCPGGPDQRVAGHRGAP